MTTTTSVTTEAGANIGEFGKNVRVIVPVLLGIIFVTGLTGNVLVLIITGRQFKTRSICISMVRFLSMVDLAFLFLNIPTMTVEYALSRFPFGLFWCKVSQYMSHVFGLLSIFVLTLMSLDRFFAIVFPLKCVNLRQMRHVHVACGGAVVLACLLNIPALFTFNVLEYVTDGEQYSSCTTTIPEMVTILFILFFSCGYVIPLILLTIIYSVIFYTLTKRERMFESRSNMPARVKNYKAAKLGFVLVLGFLVCWSPLHIFSTLMFLTDVFDADTVEMHITTGWMFIGANVFCFANSCINPILYTFVSKESRLQCKALFRKRCLASTASKRTVDSSSSNSTKGFSYSISS